MKLKRPNISLTTLIAVLLSAIIIFFGASTFTTKPALADKCIGGWWEGNGYCGGWNVCHFGNCPCGCGTGCRDSWDNNACVYDSGENKCWSNLVYSCAGFDYGTCVGQGGCQWCVSAQSCPTACGQPASTVPNGECGQTSCSATAACGFTVSTSAGANGTISPTSRTVNSGSTTTFTITPNTGYTAAASGCGGSLSGTTYTTGAITAACTVTASFTINTYTVSTSAGTGGSISPTSRTVNYNSTTTFTVTPNTGYTAAASGCGGSLSGTTYTTGAITAACTVTATFTLSTFTLTVTKAGAGTGTVTSNPAGISCGATCSYSFNSGTSVVLSASASSGSIFSGWSGSGCSGTGTCTISMTTARSVTGTFISTGTLTVATTPATISPAITLKDSSGTTVGTGNGPSKAFTIPSGTYSITYGSVTDYDSPTPNPKTVTFDAASPMTVTGNYTAQPGTLAVRTTPFATIKVDGVSWNYTPQTRPISAGFHTITFGSLTGYYTPGTQTVEVKSNRTTTVNVTYVLNSGIPLPAPELQLFEARYTWREVVPVI